MKLKKLNFENGGHLIIKSHNLLITNYAPCFPFCVVLKVFKKLLKHKMATTEVGNKINLIKALLFMTAARNFRRSVKYFDSRTPKNIN